MWSIDVVYAKWNLEIGSPFLKLQVQSEILELYPSLLELRLGSA